MLTRLKQNWSIKLFCFLAAAGLWVYVSASQSTLGKFPSSLKIKAFNVPSGLTAIYDTSTVEIKIMAEPAVWRQLSPESFSAYIDLSSYSAGTLSVPVNVVSSIPGVQIVERNPESIIVTLEPVVTKEVSIAKKIEGSAADGMTAGTVTFTPDKVTVRGAKSVIDGISEAMAIINLNGENEAFKKTLPLQAYDDKGEVVEGIDFSPSEVAADIPIVKASNNKTVGIKVKTTGSPKSGYYVSSLSVTPNVVDVIGPLSIISDINYIETNGVDLADQSNDFEKEVALNVPAGIMLQNGTASKVKVSVSLKQDQVTREMTATLSTDTIDSGYKVTMVAPSQIKVMVSGSADAINALAANDVVYAPDLRGKTAGAYNFNINNSDITLPTGLTAISVLPSAISVTIDKK